MNKNLTKIFTAGAPNKGLSLAEKIRGDGVHPIIRNSTRRFVLQMGFACNARCSFCYYLDSIESRKTTDYSTEEVKKRLREAKSSGLDQVDLSGGEPTIRPDLAEVISYARDIGFVKVAIITNGICLVSQEYAKSLIEAGLNDILFSTHGTTKEEHESLVRVDGSFEKIWKAVENVSKFPEVELRFNMTVTDINYKSVRAMLECVKSYNPYEVNFLVFNGSQEAKGSHKIDNIEIGKEISNALNKYKHELNIINVRWLPFCTIKGHEEIVQSMWQKMYEDKEWDPYLNIKHNKGRMVLLLSILMGFMLYPFIAPRYGLQNIRTIVNEALSSLRSFAYYTRVSACKRCSLKKICPGFVKGSFSSIDSNLVEPYSLGFTVRDPLFFSRKEQFTSLRS